jgi:putative hydrolase of the HAD superfamily
MIKEMLPRAVFFDLDDTLLDGYSAMLAAWAVVCSEASPRLGCEPDALRDAIRREAMSFWKDESAVGHWRVRLADARTHVIHAALEAEGWDVSLAEGISRRYGEEHRAALVPFDDALETVEAVRAAGVRVGLLTNGPRALQRDKVERFKLEPLMDVIVIEGEFGRGKPAREVFEHGLRVLGAPPEQAWHVGDNLYADIGGAKGCGLSAAWIHRDRLELREDVGAARPDLVISNLRQLRDALAV